jgi:FAD binding domain-containing protein/berberine-like enzyme
MKRRDFLNSSLAAAVAGAVGIRAAYALASEQATDVAGITGDGKEVTLKAADIRELAGKMRGKLLLAGDDGYDKARQVLNPAFDKHPALIAQPTGAADVEAAVAFARAYNLLVAVKCGGHSHSGQSTCERGMQIDLSAFRGVRVDPGARRAFVAGGTLLGQVDHEALAHGFVTPLGTVSHTGVGGLTTGGGFGRLARKYGMAIDNLESVDVVCGDGKLRRASAKENPDLFWGVRGGGGNFGVVTNFEFKLHPRERQVVAGEVVFPIARAREILSMWAEYAAGAPDELYVDPGLVQPPGGAPGIVSLEVCYCGPQKDAEKILAPVRKLGTPLKDTIAVKDYEQVQRSNDSDDNRSMGSYLKGGFITEVPDKLISAIVDGFPGSPNRVTVLFAQHCGGAASRASEGATAFAQRDSLANMMTASAWLQGSEEPAAHMNASRKYWSTLEPFTRGFYVNDLAREATAKEIDSNYRGNHQRLVKVKQTYDPTNLFRLNANIKPTPA